MEVVSIPIIVAVVYGVMEGLKTAINKEGFNRFIPILSFILGAVLGVLAFYIAPAIIPADNVLIACLLGALSGLGATGTNQAIKQLTKKEE